MAARSQEYVTEKSGSCALVMLVVDDWRYVANVGDSRAIMSGESGERLFLLSKDHKPGSEDESNVSVKLAALSIKARPGSINPLQKVSARSQISG